MLILGTGLGLSSVSPWAQSGVSAKTLGISTILWLTFTQIVASALGGYLAGRLRTRWTSVARDEVYFRDTAHGFLAWAVASLATAALLSSAVGSIVGAGAQAAGSVASGAATTIAGTAGAAATVAAKTASNSTQGADTAAGQSGGPLAYYVDSLFRRNGAAPPTSPDQPAPTPPSGDAAASAGPNPTAEVTRIFGNAIASGSLPQDDVRYLAQLISQRAGIDQQEAERRVTDTFSRMQTAMRDAETTARDAADKARKASAATALWMFVSLLIGAFVASWSATRGGLQRDL